MSVERNKPHLVSVRLTSEMHRLLEDAQQLGPYELTKATIIERGIILAVLELEKLYPERTK